MIKICLNCKKPFEARSSKQKFCSRKCSKEYKRRMKAIKTIGITTPLPEFLDVPKVPTRKTFEAFWSTLLDWQEQITSFDRDVKEVTIRIAATKPIYVAALADMHIGAIGCRYRELKQTLEAMAKIPRLYVIGAGDTIDNFLPGKYPSGIFETIMPPAMQKLLAEWIHAKLAGRWLALTKGDHEHFSKTADDFDFTAYLSEKLGCPYLGWGGKIYLIVGHQTYTIMVRHRYRFNSALNLTHTVKRMREQLGDFEIGIVGHNHQPSIEQVPMSDGKFRIFIRPGSFKKADQYAQQLGFVTNEPYIPVVKLWPDKHKMVGLPDISFVPEFEKSNGKKKTPKPTFHKTGE